MSGNSYKHPLKWAKMPKPLGDIDMPWLKVHRGTLDACWPWLGTLNSDGYGVRPRAHRQWCCGPGRSGASGVGASMALSKL